MMTPWRWRLLWGALLLLLAIIATTGLSLQTTQSYDTFLREVGEHAVREVTFRGDMLEVRRNDGMRFRTRNPETDYTQLIGTLQQAHVMISAEPRATMLLGWRVPPAVKLACWGACAIYALSWFIRREG